ALLLRAEGEDRQRGSARVHGDGDADASVGPRQLLEPEDVGEEVGPGATVLLGHTGAHQPELAQLREQVAREAVLAVPRSRVGRDLRLGDLPRHDLDLPLLGAESEVHRRSVYAGSCGRGWWLRAWCQTPNFVKSKM